MKNGILVVGAKPSMRDANAWSVERPSSKAANSGCFQNSMTRVPADQSFEPATSFFDSAAASSLLTYKFRKLKAPRGPLS